MRIAGAEETQQLGASLGVEPLIGPGEEPPGSVEGIVFAASMAEGLVLDPPADLIDPLVGQLADVEGIGDLDGGGEHGVDRQPPRTRQVQHGPANGVTPHFGLLVEPLAGASGGAALDDIEQLSGFDIDDRGRPRLGPPAALPGEEHLIEPQRGHRTDAGRVLDQRCPIRDDGIVDGVPISAELDRDLVDRPTPPPDLFTGPPASPIRHGHPAAGDEGSRFGGCSNRQIRKALVPPQGPTPHPDPKRRKSGPGVPPPHINIHPSNSLLAAHVAIRARPRLAAGTVCFETARHHPVPLAE